MGARALAPGLRCRMCAVALADNRRTLRIACTCSRPDATPRRPTGGDVARRARSSSRPFPAAPAGAYIQAGAPDPQRDRATRALCPSGATRRSSCRSDREKDAAGKTNAAASHRPS
jgi:hypothetical protein